MEESFKSMTIDDDMMVEPPPLKRRIVPIEVDKPTDKMEKDLMYDDDETSLSSNNSNGVDEESHKIMYRLVFGERRADEKFNVNKNTVDNKIEDIIRTSRFRAIKDNLMNPGDHRVSSTRDDFFVEQDWAQLPSMLPKPVRKRSQSFDDLDVEML